MPFDIELWSKHLWTAEKTQQKTGNRENIRLLHFDEAPFFDLTQPALNLLLVTVWSFASCTIQPVEMGHWSDDNLHAPNLP